jgi:hypothetical protein
VAVTTTTTQGGRYFQDRNEDKTKREKGHARTTHKRTKRQMTTQGRNRLKEDDNERRSRSTQKNEGRDDKQKGRSQTEIEDKRNERRPQRVGKKKKKRESMRSHRRHPFVARPFGPLRFADFRRPKTRHRCRSRHLIGQKDKTHEPHTYTQDDGTTQKEPLKNKKQNMGHTKRAPQKQKTKHGPHKKSPSKTKTKGTNTGASPKNVTHQNQPRNHCCRCQFCSLLRSGWWFWTLPSTSGHSPLLPGVGLGVWG